MIKIDLLKNHPHTIPSLARLWHEVLGKIWFPELEVQAIESLTYDELKYPHAITSFVALCDDIPVGFCTFKLKEDFCPDLGPWVSDLVVDPRYQKQGIGQILIHVALQKASELGFEKLYLFTFDVTLTPYYQKLGWKKIGLDEFKPHPVTVMEIGL